MRIDVVGSANIDLVANLDRLPEPGETLASTSFALVPGGKGANQAVAAARLGAQVRFVGAVGEDAHGDTLLAALQADGIDTSATHRLGPASGQAFIFVDRAGDTMIVTVGGANHAVRAEHVDVAGAGAVLCVLEVRDEVIAAAAVQCTGVFAVNVAPPRPLPPGVLERADLIVANSHEFAAVPGVSAGRLVAVTMGSEGARLLRDGAEVAYCRPPAVPVIDGTAAGDAFTAALLVALLEQMPDADALRFAVTAGAVAVRRHGAQPSLPRRSEVEALLSPV
jgi:ribokinase